MSDKKEALETLLAMVKAGELDAVSLDAAFPRNHEGARRISNTLRAYNGSLDAAKALHEAVLGDGYIRSGWKYVLWGSGEVSVFDVVSGLKANGEVREKHLHSVSPARAWLLAILEALIAEASE